MLSLQIIQLYVTLLLLVVLTWSGACIYALRTWDEASSMAAAVTSRMTIDQRVKITTGVDGPCTGNSGNVPGFPSLCLQDGPLGVRGSKGTSAFVAGINAAASFDRALIRQRGAHLGQEFRGKGINVILGPNMDILRVPEGGRNWDSFGEDPYLSGVVAAETILGTQSEGVICTAKHYIANNQETNRKIYSSNLDDRTLHEIYLWPFARSVEAGVGSVMCSYNRVDDVFACENNHTLTSILRDELGFQGWVVSDWHATHSTAKAANAGLDMSMPGDDGHFGSALLKAADAGKVSEQRLTEMVHRIAAAWYKMGQDQNYPGVQVQSDNDVQSDHKTGIREMGAASTVLLKNEANILPINPAKVKKIAVIGSDAGKNPIGPNTCPANYCPFGTVAEGGGSDAASFPYVVTPLEGITARAKKDSIKVTSFLNDLGPVGDIASSLFPFVAKNADVAIVCVSAFSAEAFDRVSKGAGPIDDLLIKRTADANKNTIVIIHATDPIEMPWIDHPNIKAVVWPGLPGQETGNSLADVLFGDVNPSARLPFTIAKKMSDYPASSTWNVEIDYKEKLLVGYKWFDAKKIDPLFEFGAGLSYTQFTYRDLSLQVQANAVTASLYVKNSGNRDGAEVVQVYVSFPAAAQEPPKLLRGFDKVYLEVGREQQVNIELDKQRDLSIWKDKQWTVLPGEYQVHVGASSRDLRLQASFSLH